MEGFKQLCVWEGVFLGDSTAEDFEKLFKDNGYTVKFCEEVVTLPDVKNGKAVEGTGGRTDIFFYISNEDCLKFAVSRFNFGRIRWWEDILGNGHGNLYPDRILEKYPNTWKEN